MSNPSTYINAAFALLYFAALLLSLSAGLLIVFGRKLSRLGREIVLLMMVAGGVAALTAMYIVKGI